MSQSSPTGRIAPPVASPHRQYRPTGRIADSTIITLTYLDFFNFIRCSNNNVHTVKYEGSSCT